MTRKMIDDTTGVILAGGASSRFGSNKALALLAGTPLIGHTAATLDRLFPAHLLVTNTPDTYRFLDWPTTADHFQQAGPLAGIHAALSAMTTSRAFIAGCDMPMVSEPLIRLLCDLAGDWDAVVPWPDGRPEPLYAVYHRDCLEAISAQLAAGERKIGLLFPHLRIRRVTEAEILSVVSDLSTFCNVNRPGDLPLVTDSGANR